MNTESPLLEKLKEAAAAFGYDQEVIIKPVGNGLINHSYLVTNDALPPLLLQRINATVFKNPADIQHNYLLLSAYLEKKKFFIPPIVKTISGDSFFRNNEEEYWRAFEYIPGTYSPDLAKSKEDAVAVADCFSRFTVALGNFPVENLKTIIPGFHDLAWRYQQFTEALAETKLPISGELKELVDALQERKALVDVYNHVKDETPFPLHVMHHDCKVSNILFNKETHAVFCPVDLDTVMPGKFFSDLGDMVRTMCCTVDENSTDWENIGIKEEFYEAVTNAYLTNAAKAFTKVEQQHIHYAGLLLIYMQALRFLTDHLNGNVYYKVQYAEQNFHRAKNQTLLLKQLEIFLNESGLYPCL